MGLVAPSAPDTIVGKSHLKCKVLFKLNTRLFLKGMFKFLDQSKLKPIGISVLLLRGWGVWVVQKKYLMCYGQNAAVPFHPTFEKSAWSAETL